MSQYKDKQKEIKDTLIQLLKKKPIHKIPVKEICDFLHMARSTFYSYYSDIYDVMEQIEEEQIAALKSMNTRFFIQDFRKDVRSSYRYFIPTLEYIRDRKETFQVLMNAANNGTFIYKWKKIISEDFADKYHYERCIPENEGLVLEMISSTIIGAYTYWINNDELISVETIAKELFRKTCTDFITKI